MPTLAREKSDIQGLILSGYGRFEHALFLLLNISDARKARSWVGKWRSAVTCGDQAETIRQRQAGAASTALQMAFTHPGLIQLELPSPVAEQFAYQFQMGMTTERRNKYLGDTGKSDPRLWEWGGQGNSAPAGKAIHMVLMIYGEKREAFDRFLLEIRSSFAAAGLRETHALETRRLPEHREHFGFRDGISNPGIEGFDTGPDLVAPGEFLLGYRNEYDLFAPRPLIEASQGNAEILPADEEGSGLRDLGRNGSFLVLRQMSQDVNGFWQAMGEAARSTPLDPVAIAAKIIGRWPDGTPMTVSPDREEPGMQDKNDFRYHDGDSHGLNCPIGAHIRRTNPRDSLDPEPGTERSLDINRRHRIIRRGRTYGEPVDKLLCPGQIGREANDGKSRGLHFVCFNVTFNRQFEFITDTWVNSPKFAGLYDEPDPLMGDRGRLYYPHGGKDTAPTGCPFTIPASPVRHRVQGLPRFVQTVGGGYFFMPGLRALHYLSAL